MNEKQEIDLVIDKKKKKCKKKVKHKPKIRINEIELQNKLK